MLKIHYSISLFYMSPEKMVFIVTKYNAPYQTFIIIQIIITNIKLF